jgi:tetratricopeptide (TPR) repeat protein
MAGARENFKQLVTRNKNNDAAYYYLAQIAGYAGQWENAVSYLDQALRLQPDNYGTACSRQNLLLPVEIPLKLKIITVHYPGITLRKRNCCTTE